MGLHPKQGCLFCFTRVFVRMTSLTFLLLFSSFAVIASMLLCVVDRGTILLFLCLNLGTTFSSVMDGMLPKEKFYWCGNFTRKVRVLFCHETKLFRVEAMVV